MFSVIFLIGILWGGVELGPLGTAATNRPIVPAPGDYDDGEIGGMKFWEGKPKYSKITYPSASLTTTNPVCCPDANTGRRGGKTATNRLSYGTDNIYRHANNNRATDVLSFFISI
jgi:hypothetical protein